MNIDFREKFIKTYNKKPTSLELIQYREWCDGNRSLNHWKHKKVNKQS